MYNVLLRNLLHLFLCYKARHVEGKCRPCVQSNQSFYNLNELFIKGMQFLRMRSSGDEILSSVTCLHNPCLSLFRFVSSPERSEFNGKTGSDRN